MYVTRTCLEKETLLLFRICSGRWLCCSFAVVGWLQKSNLTSLLNSLLLNHDLQQHISAWNVSPPPPHPKNNKNKLQNEGPCRDGIPKKQPNKVETTPQYFYRLPSLHLLPTISCGTYIITWHDRKLVQHNCAVYILWRAWASPTLACIVEQFHCAYVRTIAYVYCQTWNQVHFPTPPACLYHCFILNLYHSAWAYERRRHSAQIPCTEAEPLKPGYIHVP